MYAKQQQLIDICGISLSDSSAKCDIVLLCSSHLFKFD